MASTDTFLNLAQGLSGNIKDANKQMGDFNDLSQSINKSFESSNKNFSSINDVSSKVNDSFDDISESAENTNKSIGDWKSGFNAVLGLTKKMAGAFSAIFVGGNIIDAIQDTFQLHQEMTDLSYRMGDAGRSAGELNQAIIDTQLATGKSAEEITKMVSALGYMRVASKDMRQLATDAMNFSTVTGATQDQVTNLVGGLSRIGRLGADSISSIMGNMVQVQRQFGMSTESVNSLTEGIVNTTKTLTTLGKSSRDIEKFQKGAVKLAGAFESVGIEASEAAGILDRLLDPGKIEDNALLYAKLGISIEDAINGNINPEEVARGLQGIGAELKDMGGPAASALAQSMGMSLTQLRQMAEMDVSQVADQFGLAADASSMMNDAMGEQQTSSNKMAQMWEKIKGTLSNVLEKFMPIFDSLANVATGLADDFLGMFNGWVSNGGMEKITKTIAGWIDKIPELIEGVKGFISKIDPKILLVGIGALIAGFILIKRRFASVSTDSKKKFKEDFREASYDIGKALEDGVTGGLEMAAEKSAEVMKSKMKSVGHFTSEEFQRRVAEGHQYGALDAEAEYQKILAGQDVFGWASAVNNASAKWFNTVKQGGKPVSLLSEMHKSIQGRLLDKYREARNYNEDEMKFLVSRNQMEEDIIRSTEDRISTLEGITNRTSAQNRELDYQRKLLDETAKANKTTIERQVKLDNDRQKRQERYLNLIGANERAELLATQERKINNMKLERIELAKSMKVKKQEADLMKTALEATINARDELLQKQRDGVELSADESVRLGELVKQSREMSNTYTTINSELETSRSQLEQMTNEIEQASKEAKTLEESVGNAKFDESKASGFAGAISKLGSIARGVLGESIAGPIEDFFAKTGKSFSNMGKGIKQIFSAGSIGAGFRTVKQGLATAGATMIKNVAVAGANLIKNAATAGASFAKKVGKSTKNRLGDFFKGKAQRDKDGNVKLDDQGNEMRGDNLGKRFGKGLFGSLKKIVGGLGKMMMGGVIGLIGGALMKSEAGQKIMEKLSELLPRLMEALGPAFDSLVPLIDNFIEAVGPVIDTVGTLIAGFVEKLIPTIQGIFEKVMPVIINLMNSLVPIFNEILSALLPVFTVMLDLFMGLVTSLLPAFMPLFKVLADLMMPLVKILLPPILRILAVLANVIGTLISAIGDFIIGVGNLPFMEGLKDVGEGIKSVGNGISSAGDKMMRAADIMDGTALELKGVVADMEDSLKKLGMGALKENVAALNTTMGMTTNEALEMSHEELVQNVIANGKRDELVDQMIKNTEQLALQYTQLQAQNTSETLIGALDAAREALKTQTISSANLESVFEWGDFRNDLGRELVNSGMQNQFYEALKAGGGSLTKETAKQFKDVFKNVNDAVFGDSVFNDIYDRDGTLNRDKLTEANRFLQEGDTLQRMEDYISTASISMSDSIRTSMQQALEGNQLGLDALSQITNEQIQAIIDSSNGDNEKINAALTRLLGEQGGVIQQSSLNRSIMELAGAAQSRLEEATAAAQERINRDAAAGVDISQTDVAARNEARNLAAEIGRVMSADIGRGTGMYANEEARLAALETLLRQSDSAATAAYAGQLELIRLAEAAAESGEKTAENTTPEGQIEVTEKLYPAIIEASSSGFVQTSEALRVKKGSNEAVTAENTTLIYEEIAQLVALTKANNDMTEEELNQQIEQIAVAQAERRIAQAEALAKLNG